MFVNKIKKFINFVKNIKYANRKKLLIFSLNFGIWV